jgi:hypothetical protein
MLAVFQTWFLLVELRSHEVGRHLARFGVAHHGAIHTCLCLAAATILQVVTYIETKWRPLSPPSANKLAARASLRVDTQSANSAPLSPKDGYLTLSPCPEITRFVFDEMINELHHGAEQPAAVPPGA